MKNKFIARLLSLVTIMVLLYSCRNELTTEQETYNNSGQFRPTSKTIRLEQSIHRLALKAELQKANSSLQKIIGKTVGFSNIFVDIDHVTYIENGPNFYTYTFNLIRENASENAPIENLVLAPKADGTYKEILVTYNLTDQEKQSILNGENISTKGKSYIMELNGNAFNSIASKSQSCSWVEADSYTWCSEGVHHNGEGSGSCTADVKSKIIKVMLLKCESIDDGSGNTGGSTGGGAGDSGGGGGSGTGSGGGTPTEPCNGTGIATGPLEPSTDIGDGSSCTGIPTIPTLPNKTNPCEKTKNMLARPNVQQGIANVKAQAQQTLSNMNTGETGFKEKRDGTVVPADITSSHQVKFNDTTDSYGGYHNHTATGIHMFSPPDIVDTLFGFAAAQSVADGVGNAYFGMIAAEWCNTCSGGKKEIQYVIRYGGTGTELANFVYSPAQMIQIIKDYQKTASDLSDPYINGTTYSNSSGDLNEKGLEKLFFDTLTNMGLDNKVVLQRVEPNGAVYNVTKDSSGSITGIPCP
ncbi:hypothetical protein [Chryseobacterium sediminis]|uniref:hypothetical protein n=1 Tax=Chryseobacterium sediminis TaxID=1679494 RepID=UPI0028662B4F|nr:hypothetical protein [Chryseobacterium sediminis]MDR6465952.1 hypothetical protein [Chryseobacterium sediminis]